MQREKSVQSLDVELEPDRFPEQERVLFGQSMEQVETGDRGKRERVGQIKKIHVKAFGSCSGTMSSL